jgi:hypothetical protein
MGFINLLAFGYLSLIALVVLIYFFSKKKFIVAVPSIIPWSVLKEDVVRSRLFRIDLLFLLQIILILILIFFLAHPYFKSNIINISGKSVILVIDSSASMQTSEDKGSRFDQARSQALKMVDKLKQWDKMMVISADYSSRIACNFTEDKHRLNKTINDLLPRDTGTNLDEGVSLGISFLRNVERGEMYVLTDQSPSSTRLNLFGQVSFTKLKSGNIKFIRYGEKSANVAISSLDVYQDMFKDYTEREAYVTIKNYSDDNKDVKLSVFLNDEIIKEEELELAADKQKTVSVKNLSTSGILKARIETDDSLSVDNTAYAIINEIKPINILLVSNDYRLQDELEKIEQGTHRIKLTRISVSEYEPEAVKDYDVAIFHEFIPDESPGINSLYTIQNISALNHQAKGVKEGNNFSSILISKHGMVSNVEILDWDNTHPTMMHLHNLDDLNIKIALTMEPPDWSTALIKVSDGLKDSPIAFAGQYAGKKVATLGFDLSDFDFSKSENLRILIMTLNIIQWLNPYEVEDHNKLLTGGQYRPNYVLPARIGIGGKDNIQILNPQGDILKYDIKGDAEDPFVFNKIDYVGEYEISGADFKNRFVANLFDEEESRIMPELTDDTELKFEEKEALTLIKDRKTEFGKYLLLLVPFILLLEWLLYYKKLRAGTA